MLARSKEKALLKFASFRAMERRASRIRTNHRARTSSPPAPPARLSLHRSRFTCEKQHAAPQRILMSKQAKPPRSEDDPRRDRS